LAEPFFGPDEGPKFNARFGNVSAGVLDGVDDTFELETSPSSFWVTTDTVFMVEIVDNDAEEEDTSLEDFEDAWCRLLDFVAT
jgi:hypothetical protein